MSTTFLKWMRCYLAPASVIVTAVESGKSFRAGKLDNALLDLSFGFRSVGVSILAWAFSCPPYNQI